MEMSRGYRAKDGDKIQYFQNGGIGENSDTLLVIKAPDSRTSSVLSRSVFLVMIILTLPTIWSIARGLSSSSNISGNDFGSYVAAVEFLDLLLQDLADEGLIKKGNRALISSSGFGGIIDSTHFFNANEIDLVLGSDLEQEILFPNASFDFALSLRFEDARSLDRFVKVGGLLVTQLSNDHSNAFQKLSNYKIVYLRRYDSTVVAVKKTNLVNQMVDSAAKRRRPLELAMGAKEAALKGLEDALLEPPRSARNSQKYIKKFKYLPDYLRDSLEDYPRRIFNYVGLHEEMSDAVAWFNEFYPTRNQDFEFHSIEADPEGVSNRAAPYAHVSHWLMKNVREDEFVVMKAEAAVVEEMIKRRSIGLVDELFLECINQWQKGVRKKSKRAYWECLALYGRLRDEGVAVHQWWG